MKKHAIFQRMLKLLFLFFIVVIFGSCEKTEYIQKFDDVFDLSGVNELNAIITSAKSAEDLSSVFNNANLEIPDAVRTFNLNELAQYYENNIKLSSEEIDMLLKNDSKTYLKVINRFGSFPSSIEKIEPDLDQIKSSSLGKFLVNRKVECENFYSDDYYSAILAYQNFIRSTVIEPIKEAEIFGSGNLKSAEGKPLDLDPSDDPNILGYKLIVINNNWVMWWTYYTDGTRTKHKGAVGDTEYPGF